MTKLAIDCGLSVSHVSRLIAKGEEGKWLSGAGESHPRALPEPYVNLSIHTAPIVQPFAGRASVQIGPAFEP